VERHINKEERVTLMVKKNVLIIGAGGVAHAAAHKAAMNNSVLGNICIASRTLSKCHQIIKSVVDMGHLQDPTRKIHARQLDAMDILATVQLIRSTNSEIVINLAQPFTNMSVLEACISLGDIAYIDTAIHEDPAKVCENPPWYANYEWKRRGRCKEDGVTAILGAGFDPGVVNAYCASAVRQFDRIDSFDILDVNDGRHGKYFATNFDPEINFREFSGVWTWANRRWRKYPTHSVKRMYNFPVVGHLPVYLTGHDELHSLSRNIKADNIRFWMGFGDHYITVFTVLRTLGLLSHKPISVGNGHQVIPLKLVKALLPDPMTLAQNYTGKTCIGVFVKGWKDGKRREIFLYNVADHAVCFKEVGSQAISYTAGIPAVVAAMLVANGVWDTKTMVNVEQLDPDPFIELLGKNGLPTKMKEIEPGGRFSFDGTIGDIRKEIKAATATVTVSAANPMIAVRGK
jgi:saccharopine dehydrogenase-like NADP-dependent oxidoreductase